ncbi:hypothetical protein MADA3029_320048 [Vibrio nigripulchritudo MADA3029]|nr:hypothetical protein VIBNIMADA3020_830047 [Vibrio nigripulchritudo MADA3020]CCN56112.1 hypothetical protein VIBNIMADA3021_890003 [Vibrio nigripulchritudo MADA3021]CCN59055.1 hypothetical protein MADA3029_320048 [Vibrio nigripulchritudo MADA3029]
MLCKIQSADSTVLKTVPKSVLVTQFEDVVEYAKVELFNVLHPKL